MQKSLPSHSAAATKSVRIRPLPAKDAATVPLKSQIHRALRRSHCRTTATTEWQRAVTLTNTYHWSYRLTSWLPDQPAQAVNPQLCLSLEGIGRHRCRANDAIRSMRDCYKIHETSIIRNIAAICRPLYLTKDKCSRRYLMCGLVFLFSKKCFIFIFSK